MSSPDPVPAPAPTPAHAKGKKVRDPAAAKVKKPSTRKKRVKTGKPNKNAKILTRKAFLFPPIPESLLKKRKAHEDERRRREKIHQTRGYKKMISRAHAIRRAELYAKEYRRNERDVIEKRKRARLTGNFFVEAEPKVAFVIRIRGILGVSPKPRKVLQLLRLRRLNSGVFVRLNKATMNMLRLAEPYIAYGYPDLKTIRMLVYKRGHVKVNGQRKALTDNAIIEEHLGKYGVICMEDLVHELYTCGSRFREVAHFLWPFKLSNAKGGYKDKGRNYSEGGDSGNREDLINDLIRKMI